MAARLLIGFGCSNVTSLLLAEGSRDARTRDDSAAATADGVQDRNSRGVRPVTAGRLTDHRHVSSSCRKELLGE
jgi:hypothetical protein